MRRRPGDHNYATRTETDRHGMTRRLISMRHQLNRGNYYYYYYYCSAVGITADDGWSVTSPRVIEIDKCMGTRVAVEPVHL